MARGPGTERLKGRLLLAGYALVANESLAWLVSHLVMRIYPGMLRWWFFGFGAATLPLVMKWLRADARQAYETAAARHHLGFAGSPPRVVSIADDCPSRWLVLLHLRLHPELRSRAN